MTIQTHRISWDKTHCQRCGVEVPIATGRNYWVPGEYVLMIVAPASGVTVTHSSSNGQTPMCDASQPVARILALKFPAEVVA